MVRAGFQKAPLAVNPGEDDITETILQQEMTSEASHTGVLA